MTELRGNQDQDAACSIRLGYHIGHPLQCMAASVVSSFNISPLEAVLTKKNCFVQEAIYAAMALGANETARGACFSSFKSGAPLQETARRVRGVIMGPDGQVARQAVLQYAAGLDEGHPLRRHLAGGSFLEQAPSKIVLPLKSQSGSSGVPGHVTRQRQLARKECVAGSARHTGLHRGVDPSTIARAENARRPTTRKSGMKKRPAAPRISISPPSPMIARRLSRTALPRRAP
jgi:hypothetical protein